MLLIFFYTLYEKSWLFNTNLLSDIYLSPDILRFLNLREKSDKCLRVSHCHSSKAFYFKLNMFRERSILQQQVTPALHTKKQNKMGLSWAKISSAKHQLAVADGFSYAGAWAILCIAYFHFLSGWVVFGGWVGAGWWRKQN